MAATYLQGLTNQVESFDTGLQNFRGQLRTIPEKSCSTPAGTAA